MCIRDRFCADQANGLRSLHRAAYVGSMRNEAEPRIRADQRRNGSGVKQAVRIAWDAVEFYAGELEKRAHDGVVLHRAYQAVIPGPQVAFQNQVQPRRCARSQDYMRRLFGKSKKAGEAFS